MSGVALVPERDAAMLARYARTRDPALRDQLVRRYLPLSGELRRHFRDRGWAIRPPRDLLEQALKVERSATELQRALSRSPEVAEIGLATGLDENTVLVAREALSARRFMSLSTTARQSEEDDETIVNRRFGATEDGYATAEQRATLAPLLARLPARDRRILRLRFEQDLTQAEIGQIVGLSQMHVSRVLRTSLEHLRSLAEAMA